MLENIRFSVSHRDACGDNLTRTDLLNTLDDDQFALLDTLRYDDVAALFAACRDAPLLNFLGVVDDHHVVASLVKQYGRLRHHKQLLRCAAFDDNAHDTAGNKQAFRVWQLRPSSRLVRPGCG